MSECLLDTDTDVPTPKKSRKPAQSRERLSKAGQKSQVLARAKRVPITLPKVGRAKE